MTDEYQYGDELDNIEAARYLNDMSPHTLAAGRYTKRHNLQPYKKKGKVHFLRAVLDAHLLEQLRP